MSRRRSILTLTAVFLAWALVVPAQDAVKTLDRVNSQVAPAAHK